MKVYIKQTTETSLFEQARIGFLKMGFEVSYYEELPKRLSKEDVLVGWISDVFKGLDALGVKRPDALDYPNELVNYFSRSIDTCHINEVISDPGKWPLFIKPTKHKLFTGRVINEFKDLIGVVDCDVYYSKPLDIMSEWRVFVINGEIVGVKNYKNKREHYIHPVEIGFIKDVVSKYKSAPRSYCIDFGVLFSGEVFVIEVNDGFSCGNYGLDEVIYAKVLMARWNELTFF